MPKFRVGVFQFPYGNITHVDTSQWVLETVTQMYADPEIGPGNVFGKYINDTPVTASRNYAVECALKANLDYMVLVDSDMAPDLDMPGQKPFWQSSWEFMKAHRDTPCVIAAPYCGPPPHENVYAFRWAHLESDAPNPGFVIEQYTRMEAAALKGILPAAALATGLMIVDVRALVKLPKPYFYYDYHGDSDPCGHCGQRSGPKAQRSSTEDVTFTRDLGLYGVPLYVNWDSWSGHWKLKKVTKPQHVTPNMITKQLIEGAAAHGIIPADTPVSVPGLPESTAGRADRFASLRTICTTDHDATPPVVGITGPRSVQVGAAVPS